MKHKDVEGKSYEEFCAIKGFENDDDAYQWMSDNDLNTCDKCHTVHSTYDLIWITSEDFQPKQGEILKEQAYLNFDALCDYCYKEELE